MAPYIPNPYVQQHYDYGPTLQIANIIGRQGDAAANYAENTGKMWGLTLQQLGNQFQGWADRKQRQPLIDAQIADTYSQVKERDAQAAHYQAQADHEQRLLNDQATIGSVISGSLNTDGSIDINKASQLLGQRSDLLPAFGKIAKEHNDAVSSSQKNGLEGILGGRKLVANTAALLQPFVGTDMFDDTPDGKPGAFTTAFSVIKDNPNAVQALQPYMPALQNALASKDPAKIGQVIKAISMSDPDLQKKGAEEAMKIQGSPSEGFFQFNPQQASLAGLAGVPTPAPTRPPVGTNTVLAPGATPQAFATPAATPPPPAMPPNSLGGIAKNGITVLQPPKRKYGPGIEARMQAMGIDPEKATPEQISAVEQAEKMANKAPESATDLALKEELLKSRQEKNAPIPEETMKEAVYETSRGNKFIDAGYFQGNADRKAKAQDQANKAGIKFLPKEISDRLREADGMAKDLDALQQQLKGMTPESWATRPADVAYNFLNKFFQFDPNNAAYTTSKDLQGIGLLGALMQKGKNMRMTQTELNIAAKALPNINDTFDVVKAKTAWLKKLVGAAEDRLFDKKAPEITTGWESYLGKEKSLDPSKYLYPNR